MGLLRRRADTALDSERSGGWFDPIAQLLFDGQGYGAIPLTTMQGQKQVPIDTDFRSVVSRIHKRHGVVAAAVGKRAYLVSQARFQWVGVAEGNRGRRFGSADLAKLEGPKRAWWLAAAERDASHAGNAYILDRDAYRRFGYRGPGGLYLMRPDLTDVVLGSNQDIEEASTQLDAEVLGYAYHAKGRHKPPTIIPAEVVAHWAPEPDPVARWRGESWVSSIVREVMQANQVSGYVDKFFENAATSNLVVKSPANTPDQFKEWVKVFEEAHAGTANAWKNIYLGGGADAMVVGSKLNEIAMSDLRAELEVAVAVRAFLPATMLGIREGLQGSTLNSGNYAVSRRSASDTWYAPHLDMLCEALSTLVAPPTGGPARLTYDPDAVLFLQEDAKDAAEIVATKAQSIRTLADGGFEPDSVRDAVTTGDLSKLVHTGLPSVQVQAPVTE